LVDTLIASAADRQALRAEGLDPDDLAVIAAIDLVRWELSLISNAAS
jgi:cobalamin biosynthesis protein CbiG